MYKKAAIFVLIIIFIGLVIFNRPSNLSESFSNWVSPANSPDTKKEVVVLPNLKDEIEVYYDVQNANIYIIDGPVVSVIPRTYSNGNGTLKSYNIGDADQLSELRGLSASSITSSNNKWVYSDDTNLYYLTYLADADTTQIIFSKLLNGKLMQAKFNFTSSTKPEDLKGYEFTEVINAALGEPGSDLISSDSTPGSASVITVGLFGNVYRTIKSITDDGQANWLDGKTAPVGDIKKITNTNKNPHYIGEEVYVLSESDTNAPGDNTYAAGYIKSIDGLKFEIEYKSRKAKTPVSIRELNVVVI